MIEINIITPLLQDYGIYGGYIKVVGTSFKNKASSLPRSVTIRGFFERNTSKSTYSSDLGSLVRDIDIRIIKEIESIQEGIIPFVKVKRELKNSYDPNAIAVYVNSHLQFTKIGFLPKDLSELIAENRFRFYVVGFEKNGRGMMLTMVFTSLDTSVFEVRSETVELKKNESIGFISLNKIRKKLCT